MIVPIIGILGEMDNEKKVGLEYTYAAVIESLGGLPLLLPYLEQECVLQRFIDLCDGFIFSGGADIEPSLYGEEKKSFCGSTQPYRDKLDMQVLKMAIQSKKPILCICRGMQLLNVALGGTLYQDLPSEHPTNIAHRISETESYGMHEVNILENTPLYGIVGADTMLTNTYHHQAVKKLANSLQVMAKTEDEIIEAVYYTGESYIHGYQWHPEKLFAEDDSNRAIFKDFIKNTQKKL